MESIALYVISHKKTNYTYPKDYFVLQVGNSNETFSSYRDNTNDNIASRNPFYCELTGLYWISKNAKEDIVGLEHYRRIFTKNLLSRNSKYFLNKKNILKRLEKADIITTPLYSFKKTIYQNRLEFCYEQDLNKLRETIEEVAPDYLDSYDAVLNGNESFLCNMMIARKKIFEDYASFLFPLFFALEKKIDPSKYEGDKRRVYGYLSEVLLTVFVKKNNLVFSPCKVSNLETSFLSRVFANIKRGFKK